MKAISLLQSWCEGDEQEQRETFECLKVAGLINDAHMGASCKMTSLAYRVGRILLGLLGLAAIVYTWLWTAIG